ncbi:MAG: TIR domain-containing protein, partial [Phenylobacterium sp.]
MNDPEPVSEQDRRILHPIFISYATADRAEALKVCKAIERRGTKCWISMRDVPPGANYQEAIVQSIRGARAVVLVFTGAANNSDEIKKELSLASHYGVPVIALRIEDVELSDAFAYELSTRQWIDAFKDRDRSIDSLVSRIGQISGGEPASTTRAPPALGRVRWRRALAIAAAACLVLLIAAGAWWWLRPAPAATHSMTVRLSGFQLLSPDLPAATRATVDAEIAAAFNADGVVGVSTASAPPPGSAPAYALGGTIQRDGQTIRVITHLTNERSGATLWGSTFNYDGAE